MKRFLTIFPELENVHLAKDVGMIPYFLHRERGYECTIACFGKGNYPYLNQEAKGLKLRQIRKLFKNDFLNLVVFVLSEHRRYDVLQMYHYSRETLVLLFMFRMLGLFRKQTYLKLDADDRVRSFKYHGIRGLFARFLFRSISLVTAESIPICTNLNHSHRMGKEVVYVPNGFYKHRGRNSRIQYADKSNVILSVGRLGAEQKATELVCEAFLKFIPAYPEWTLMLVGAEEPAFRDYLDNLLGEEECLRGRVIRANEVADRALLVSYYDRAKVFVLPSRWEGFPLVYLEAMASGCYIITTPVSAAFDITKNGELGAIVPFEGVEEITSALKDFVARESIMESISGQIQDYAYQNFWWPDIVETIDKKLSQ